MSNIQITQTETPNIVVTVDRGIAGVGIESVAIVFQDPDYFLEFTYTDGTTELVELPAIASGVVSFNTRIGVVTLTSADVTTALGYTPPTPTGTGASGTWNISVSGNAGTVTNGVYTTDVGTVTNTMLAGSIANNKLTNSAITINGTSTSLGGSVNVGTVTSVGGTGSVNGISLSGTVTSSGNLTLGGALTGVDLTTQVTGTLPISNGGTNATTASGARTSLGLGTSAVLDAAVALGTATLDASGTVPLSQIPASIQGGLNYQGTWNANTNTPTLVSSVGSKGHYYAVSVAGSTNLNGITDWNIGDLAVYDGSAWQKIDNTDAVTSVNGFTGSVVLTTTNVAEGTNEYFTTAKARSSVSAGTGITYNSTTGVITNASPSLGGDVVGAASSTDNAVTRFNGTTGKLIQNSAVIIDDSNNVTGVNSLTATTLVVNDNATLGGSNADSLAVNARISTDLEPATDNARDIGTNGRNWRDGFFGRNLSTVNLAVTGTTSYDGAQGTSGQVLTSAGTGNTPTWTTPTTGTVTSVGGTGTVNGITLSGTVTSSGNLTLGGTLSGVNLTTQVTGTLPVANGGTGITSLGAGVATFLGTPTSANLAAAVTNETGTGALVFGTSPTLTTPTITGGTVNPTTLQENGSPVVVQTDIGTAPNEIPLNQYLGNLAYQDAANIAGSITAGSINNTPIGSTTASTGAFTTLGAANLTVGGGSGSTLAIFRSGSAQSGNLISIQNTAGTELISVNANISALTTPTINIRNGSVLEYLGTGYIRGIGPLKIHDTHAGNVELVVGGGNVGVGTTSPATKLDVSGAIRTSTGILFGTDTAAANTLDDYEEGTWTPSLEGSTTAGTQTYIWRVGAYTKIGNRVFGNCQIIINVKDVATAGNLKITGLPFTAANNGIPIGAVSLLSNLTLTLSATYASGTVTQASTEIVLNQIGSASLNNIPAANFANGTQIQISFDYYV
jgi:hypothetical protein